MTSTPTNNFQKFLSIPVFSWPARFLLGHMSVTFGKIPSFQLTGDPIESTKNPREKLEIKAYIPLQVRGTIWRSQVVPLPNRSCVFP